MTNLKNRTIYCHDNLDILKGIDSNTIDLIYLDPPFNKNKIFTAPIDSSAEGASFKDIFREEDVKDEWVFDIQRENYELYSLLRGIKEFSNHYNYCYSVYMAIRLLEIWRILKPTGSVYLHCDPTMSHYLKLVLDCIFDEKNFRNEIIWAYRTGGVSKKYHLAKKHDIIFWYSKEKKFFMNAMKEKQYLQKKFMDSKIDEDGNIFIDTYLRDILEDVIEIVDNNKVIKEYNTRPVLNLSKERTGYPTQKPVGLISLLIDLATNEDDMVLDPFCGCATTCIAAEKLGRNWVGIDVSQKAYELVKIRLKKEVPPDFFRGEPHFTTTPPTRSDMGMGGEVAGYIYIISNPKYKKWLKVGIAKDPEARLKQYQTGDPERKYKIEKIFQTPHNADIEKMIHQHYNAPTEWVATGEVDEVFNLIKQFDTEIKGGLFKN
ncbi:MAG: DNA methyltransferase [Alphaproteobacteria bacterium]